MIANGVDEDFANIKLAVKEGYEEATLDILQNWHEPRDFSDDTSVYIGHPYASELKKSDIQYFFCLFREGKRAKTRYTEVYAVYDENGQMYIYIMG